MTRMERQCMTNGDQPRRDRRSLEYQLDFLKLEFNAINEAIRRIDQTTQGTKNWAIGVWAGSMGLSLAHADLRNYVPLTAIVPLMFWFIDAYWRHIQRTMIFRIQLISEFLNGPDLSRSIES